MVEPSTALAPCWEERSRGRYAAPPPGNAVADACWRHRPLATPTSESRDAVTALEMPHTLTFSTPFCPVPLLANERDLLRDTCVCTYTVLASSRGDPPSLRRQNGLARPAMSVLPLPFAAHRSALDARPEGFLQ